MLRSKSKITTTIALVLILTFSALMTTMLTSTAVEAADDYGDVLQYEWPQRTGSSPTFTRFSAGPAPDAPNILWKFKEWGGTVVPFNGKVFASRSGGRPGTAAPPPMTWALDPFTGSIIWQSSDFASTAVKIDDTRMLIGRNLVEIETGRLLWTAPGSFSGRVYVPELKMAFARLPVAWNLSDLSQPPIKVWDRSDLWDVPTSAADTCYGDGKVFGSGLGYEIALNATTGETVWVTELTGTTDYSGCYYMGRWLKAGLDGRFYCLDGDTGEVLWIYNAGGFWNYWSSGMAAGYGKVYMLNGDTHLYALDVKTGKMVWKYKGSGNVYPGHPVVGGGKVYQTTGNREYRDPITGEYGPDEYSCVDAETGKLVWKLPIAASVGKSDAHSIAYGNLYVTPYDPITRAAGEVWCIGSRPKDWSMFRGDAVNTAEGSGPENLALKWKYQTDGIVISSPTIVDGVAYVGSHDKNVYALDADTGSKIWNFTTGYRIKSSPAVVNGKVYTGADDGNIYCLDAEDGTQLWKTPAGGLTEVSQDADARIRSSPTVVGGKVYVGSIDTNVYCLDANTGTTLWKFLTPGPITSSAAVVDGAVYITSSTPRPSGTLYKLNADTGSVIWQLSIPYRRGPDMHASPTVAEGLVFVPADAGGAYGINATTGAIKWEHLRAKNGLSFVYHPASLLYAEGRVYSTEFFSLICLNATTGEDIWSTWVAREIYSSAAYAAGKVYFGNENRAFRVLDATSGEQISYYNGFESNKIWSSPTLYNGRAYIGSIDGGIYCFEEDIPDAPLITTEVTANLSKSQVDKDISESVTVSGVVSPIYASIPVKVTFTKPDGTTIDVSATTTTEGDFEVSYTPDVVGAWSATAWWEGDEDRTFAFTEDMPLKVVGEEPTNGNGNGNGTEPPPEDEGIPTEYIYAAVAVIAIVIIAIAAYVYLKRGK